MEVLDSTTDEIRAMTSMLQASIQNIERFGYDGLDGAVMKSKLVGLLQAMKESPGMRDHVYVESKKGCYHIWSICFAFCPQMYATTKTNREYDTF